MMASRPFNAPVFYVSLFLAFLLFFYPLRGDLAYWRPQLVFLTVVFWVLVEPHTVGVGIAWLAGACLDLLTGGPLGQNAFAMAVAAYLLQLAGQRLNNYSVWHQTLIVAALAIFYQMIIIVAGLIAGKEADTWRMLYPVITTVLLWPPLAVVLGRLYRPE